MGLQDEINSRAKSAAIGGLGDVMQSPLARAAVKYWWVALPVGYCAWRSWQSRKAKGDVNALDVVLDTAPVVSLIATLVLLNQALKAGEGSPRPATAAAPPLKQGPVIRDADFTPKPKPKAEAADVA